MNITALYKKLNEGKISKDFFMKNVRMQFPQYISPVTSYKDAVNILTGKRIISEAHKLNTAQIIDRLNPYHFRRGVELEMSKVKEVNKDTYEKIREKVAKKMQKNPLAYEDQVFANAKEVEKKDEILHTKEVKEGSNVDKKNAMKVKKKAEKANVRSSKKENRKGNPRGVKHMTYVAKKAKGISQTMPATGKEKVLHELKQSLAENMMGISHSFNKGQSVHTPDGPGEVKEVIGGTLRVELHDGSEREYQINVVKSAMEKSADMEKAERDARWNKLPNLGKVYNEPVKKEGEIELTEDQINSIIEKLMSRVDELVKQNPKTKDIASTQTPAGAAVMNKLGFTQTVPGSEDVTITKSKL